MIDLHPPGTLRLEDYERLARDVRDRLLDVAKLALNSPCPRCAGRRVYQVDQERNLWLCIDGARPIPASRDQLIEHDAAEFQETQDQQVNYRGR